MNNAHGFRLVVRSHCDDTHMRAIYLHLQEMLQHYKQLHTNTAQVCEDSLVHLSPAVNILRFVVFNLFQYFG